MKKNAKSKKSVGETKCTVGGADVESCILGHIPIVDQDTSKNKVTVSATVLTAHDALRALDTNQVEVVRRYIEQNLGNAASMPVPIGPVVTSIPMKHLDTVSVDENICCWWCCHRFEGTPVYLPHWVTDGVFNVTGHFCSFACVLSYNHSQRDEHAYQRENMLVLMYRCHGRYDLLIPAPPRESLRMFGGWLTIDEFRMSQNLVRLIHPPIQSLKYTIETENIRMQSSSAGSSYPLSKTYVPLSGDHVNRAKEALKLKRNAPKKTHYVSMEETLGLVKRKMSDV